MTEAVKIHSPLTQLCTTQLACYLCLNAEENIWLRVAQHPEIGSWKGEDIIVSDGTSVLGADNKAAIAVIMTLLGRLDSRQHGDIFVAFAPDEETGLRGAKALDLSRFPCDFAYTIDCCELGEVVLETFNAASVEIVFTGVQCPSDVGEGHTRQSTVDGDGLHLSLRPQ